MANCAGRTTRATSGSEVHQLPVQLGMVVEDAPADQVPKVQPGVVPEPAIWHPLAPQVGQDADQLAELWEYKRVQSVSSALGASYHESHVM